MSSTGAKTAAAVCFITLPILLVTVTFILHQNSNFGVPEGFDRAKFMAENGQNVTTAERVLGGTHDNITTTSCAGSREDPSSASVKSFKNDSSPANTTGSILINRPPDGLVDPKFVEKSCISRSQSYLYRKESPHKPSQYLLNKLRGYEDLHARCGPLTKSYGRTMRRLIKSKHHISGTRICKYLVWTAANGLGNRMISLAAAFLYAVLTERVLLVEFGNEMIGLFCEPFPKSSWHLPEDFPYKNRFDHLQTYETLLMNTINISMEQFSVPSFLHLYLEHGGHKENFFHCDDSQSLLQKVNVLILRSDQYNIPSLFMISSFKKELENMFPEKDTVFHHLGSYLFHPSNEAWGLISRFYDAYLANSDEKIGLQIRVFNPKNTPSQTIMDQVLACTLKNKLLPQVDLLKSVSSQLQNKTSKAVLVASLYPDYTEKLRTMYWRRPTVTGEIVGVYQPSSEGKQRFNDNSHNMKAWAEMYLLSLCDVLVTSGESTFGYVAQSIGGLKPWIMGKTLGTEFREPPCARAVSMEPCFHFPPKFDCKRKTKVDHVSSVFPNMKPCVDFYSGVKMVDDP
ncbi:hypothetical protein Nepgr_025031 [Nepenthes gracilis]|uniref:Fucosyltransferase n=1 Tax=Nepenthes gracilis TaxID=150966 RepID=A0AAD3XZB7_NEPGR|nr:hypothetical protein Nepgr_025031 [Nepenthes gracilis]